MNGATLILACGNPFKNVGPFGWFLICAFLAGLGISCLLAILNPILAATMKVERRRKQLHLGLAAAYILPGIIFALLLAAGSDIGGDFMVIVWLIYFWVLPFWTVPHFFVLLSVRRKLRRATADNSLSSPAAGGNP